MLAVSLLVLVDEWEEVNNLVIEGLTVEWGIVVAAIESDVALNETIVEIELTILLKTSVCTNEADVVWFNVYRTIVFVIINAHSQGAVVCNGCAFGIFDFAI